MSRGQGRHLGLSNPGVSLFLTYHSAARLTFKSRPLCSARSTLWKLQLENRSTLSRLCHLQLEISQFSAQEITRSTRGSSRLKIATFQYTCSSSSKSQLFSTQLFSLCTGKIRKRQFLRKTASFCFRFCSATKCGLVAAQQAQPPRLLHTIVIVVALVLTPGFAANGGSSQGPPKTKLKSAACCAAVSAGAPTSGITKKQNAFSMEPRGRAIGVLGDAARTSKCARTSVWRAHCVKRLSQQLGPFPDLHSEVGYGNILGGI